MEGQQARDAYKAALQSLSGSYNRVNQKIQSDLNQSGQPSAAKITLNADQKRCLELGGTFKDCVNPLMDTVSALGTLFSGVFGASTNPNAPPPLNGVVFVGKYHSPSQLPVVTLNSN